MNYGRRIADFNGVKVWLFHPPVFDKNGVIRIHEANVENIITPLLRRDYTIKSIKRIVLDPGHGGHDKGAVGKISFEKDLNLKLALKIKDELEKAGFEVFMTRSDDTFLPLDERSSFAKEHNADIFISIHHNAASVSAANGVEIFTLPPAGIASSHENGGKITDALPGNSFDHANINLSYLIYSNIIKNTDLNDRGMKFARYQVLTAAPCPAVLLEAGFISNAKEEALLNNSDIHAKIAEAIALTFFPSERK